MNQCTPKNKKKKSSKSNTAARNNQSPDVAAVLPSSSGDSSQTADDIGDCCICVETPLHPIKLPCSHIFCFLCIKGVFLTDPLCPLCRAPIPKKCIEQPKVYGESPKLQGSKKRKRADPSQVSAPTTPQSTNPNMTTSSPTREVWFYEGRGGGWWQYDERTELAIEEAVSQGLSSLEVMLAGSIYVLDFVGKVQMKKDNPTLKRQMKKDRVDDSVKGIAGLLTKK